MKLKRTSKAMNSASIRHVFSRRPFCHFEDIDIILLNVHTEYVNDNNNNNNNNKYIDLYSAIYLDTIHSEALKIQTIKNDI